MLRSKTHPDQNYTLALLQKQQMAGGKNLMTGLLVLVVVGALVYLVDPTFFGLLKSKSGFQSTCEEDPDQPGCEGFQNTCPDGTVYDEESGTCVASEGFQNKEDDEEFQNMAGAVSNGTAGPGQMANPGGVNLANQMGNPNSMGGDFGSSNQALKQGFADLGTGPADFGSQGAPAGCYPRDQLTPAELLPKDQNSVWAEQNPMGPGSLKGKNFLSAGALIGVNTVGQSLRNANWQLRSEPPNPQMPVSIFNQSTIQPDTNRRPLEIN